MREGWEIKKLGDMCEIINGFAFKSLLFKDSGEDILRISNIQNEAIDDSDIAHFSKDDYPKVDFDKYAVLPNDIVVALSGATTGKFAINNTGRKLYLNQRVAICREKTNDIYHRFLLYFLKTQSKSFLESAAGVAQPNLSTEQMKLYEIPIPPLAEQEHIVQELDLLSGIIEKQKQQLKEYDTLAQSIFYTMFGDPITNEKGWEVLPLKDVATIIGGSTPKTNIEEYWNGEHYWVTPAELHNTRYISSTERSITDEAVNKTHLTILPAGTVLLSSRAPIGKVCITRVPMYCNQGFKNIICSDRLHCEYVYQYFLDKTDYLNSLGAGATFKEISKSTTEKITIPVPPLPLQQSFAAKIEAIEKQKELIKRSIAEAETLFNSRMDYYFN